MTSVNRTKSKSSLFLMEMIVTLLFFSIASAICVQLFAQAHILSRQAKELNAAVAISQSFVEVMRGTDGSIDSIWTQFMDADRISDHELSQYYDSDFQICNKSDALYIADVTLTSTSAFQIIHVEFICLENKSLVYELSATKYINTPQG